MAKTVDSWTSGARLYRELVRPYFGDDEELERSIVERVREHGTLGVHQWVRGLLERHSAGDERLQDDAEEVRRGLRRALLERKFPTRLSRLIDVSAETRAYLERMRGPLEHPEECHCGGRGWLSDLDGSVPPGARVWRRSWSGATTYYCPGPVREQAVRHG